MFLYFSLTGASCPKEAEAAHLMNLEVLMLRFAGLAGNVAGSTEVWLESSRYDMRSENQALYTKQQTS